MSTPLRFSLTALAALSLGCTGHLARTDGLEVGDAGPGLDPGLGADAGTDAHRPPPRLEEPGSRVTFFTYVAQNERTRTAWGDVLTDLVQHLPDDQAGPAGDGDLVAFGRTASAAIHEHLRSHYDAADRGANAFYLLSDRAVLVVEPAIRTSEIAPFVPEELRGPLFAEVVAEDPDHDGSPLQIWDAWIAHTNGGEVAVDRVSSGLWREPPQPALRGQLELTVYALATAMAVEALEPIYFRDYRQFREVFAYNARRAMEVYRRGAQTPELASREQSEYHFALATSAQAAELRAFAVRAFGTAFTHDVLGFE